MCFVSGSSSSCLLDFIPVREGGGVGEIKDEQHEQSAAGGWWYWASPEASLIRAKGKSGTEETLDDRLRNTSEIIKRHETSRYRVQTDGESMDLGI